MLQRAVAASMAFAAVATLCGGAVAATAPLKRLPLGHAVDYPMASKATLTVGIGDCTSGRLYVEVRERGVDVDVRWRNGDEALDTDDLGIPRYGIHRLALTAADCSHAELTIATNPPDQPQGAVRITMRNAPRTPSDDAAFALSLRETKAQQHAANADKAAVATEWETIASAWAALGESGREAEAWFHAAKSRKTLGQWPLADAALEHALVSARKAGDHRLAAWASNDLGMNVWRQGESRRAEAPLQDAAREAAQVDDPLLAAVVLNNRCLTQSLRDNIAEAKSCYRRALAMSRATKDQRRIGTALNNLGGAAWLEGDARQAASLFEESLAIRRAAGDKHGSADSTFNLGLIDLAAGRIPAAIARFRSARQDYDASGDAVMAASATLQLARTQALAGRSADALSLLRQASDVFEKTHSNPLLINALVAIASVEVRPDQRKEALERARSVAAIDASPVDVADVELAWAEDRIAAGDTANVADAIAHARRLAQAVASPPLLTRATLAEARLALANGDAATARATASALLDAKANVLSSVERSSALTLAANAAAASGDDIGADALFEQAERAIEAVRARLVDPEGRARFIAARRDVYGTHIDVLMRLYAKTADASYADRAFELSDRARTQDPVAANAGTGADRIPGDPRIAEINGLALAKARLPQEDTGKRNEIDRHIAALERDVALSRLGEERDGVRNERHRAFGMRDVQQRLGPDTRMLYFAFGSRDAFAWLVDARSRQAFSLGDAESLSAAARDISRAIATYDSENLQSALAALSKRLGKPLSAIPTKSVLVVVPDAALHFVPFAALPIGPSENMLIDVAELSFASSAAMFGDLERRPESRDGPLLLVADPVFAIDDARALHGDTFAYDAGVSTNDATRAGFERLRASSVEIGRIEALAPSALQVTKLSGFDANRNRVLEAFDADYAIVHFATHGLIDPNYPDASGLVLSLVTASGAPSDGFLGMGDIASRHIPARLVVLSACDTATGPEIPGQGPWGLTQAFLTAGAGSVVSSLWEVPDQAAAELMGEFYRAYFAGETVTASLRKAQLHLRSIARFHGPRAWAAFRATGSAGR